ncbi:PREDICTED: uncharacterized protein LOC109235971 [Nicotiana attenuata]|uniref:uncharacterized protein LOC109235971 n=1 Tax=Nicotiana attenuata TaxID=49451 RepID=UPI000905336A|nr:PREDICTED: uncharacterized protein LOC109235971 [Nicotiana attenuata]
MRKRLLTKEKTMKLNITEDNECMLCEGKPESIDHLFFDCTYSRMCLTEVLQWLGMNIQNTEVTGIGRRMARIAKGKAGRSFTKAALAAVIYYIWKARNEALWRKRVPRPQVLLKQIQLACKHRCMEAMKKKENDDNLYWIEQLYR